MTQVRIGAVTYLNARPLVVGLDREPRFAVQFDLPSRCAALLHEGATDVGLIPSIEYLRGPAGPSGYRIVPEVAIVSHGPVASVALYAKRPIAEVRSIALDTSSRTSVALTRVLCTRAFHIDPVLEPHGPNLTAMLDRCDAALLIGDAALLCDHAAIHLASLDGDRHEAIEKIDLGEIWTQTTGLPFVYAFWAGRPDALTATDVGAIQRARDLGVHDPEGVAQEYFSDAALQAIGARYLRDSIQYSLGESERAGLELFYRYAGELGLVPTPPDVRFF
jgi:chorismate dehydratase